MSAFWHKSKKADNDSNIEDERNVEEDIGVVVDKQTPRISRSEYKRMQVKNAGEQKGSAKDTLKSIFRRYIFPPAIIYIAFKIYQYVPGNILVKLFDKSYFWIVQILFISCFVAITFASLSYLFDRLPRIRNHFGAIAWFGSIYFYVAFLINYDHIRGPILAAMILFVTGVVQLTKLNKHLKGTFILLAALYGNYLTILDFHNVWLLLAISGLFVARDRGSHHFLSL